MNARTTPRAENNILDANERVSGTADMGTNRGTPFKSAKAPSVSLGGNGTPALSIVQGDGEGGTGTSVTRITSPVIDDPVVNGTGPITETAEPTVGSTILERARLRFVANRGSGLMPLTAKTLDEAMTRLNQEVKAGGTQEVHLYQYVGTIRAVRDAEMVDLFAEEVAVEKASAVTGANGTNEN